MNEQQRHAILMLVQAVVNAEVALSWSAASPMGEREDLQDARTRAWATLRAALSRYQEAKP